jgi:hypothetical protein
MRKTKKETGKEAGEVGMLDKETVEKVKAEKVKRTSESACELVMCFNEETGEVQARPRGNCPKGFVEKIRDKCIDKGIVFIVPKVETREE